MKSYLSDPYGRIATLNVNNGKAEFIFWQQEHDGSKIFWDVKDQHDWPVGAGCLEGRRLEK